MASNPNFTLVKKEYIKEIRITYSELVHNQTGAAVIHLGNDDKDNLFSLSFQTLPSSSNGAAHILEHTVLCGSKKYPVKDPFFGMLRRSLNTFMNAMTGSDFTCYPASSQNEKDFYHLLSVYLDAVFHPNLKRFSFLQEGHRFEFQEEENPLSPLSAKGVVYNEMKGAMSSEDSVLWHTMMEELYPDLPYRHNSGGEPEEILNLSYEELLEFHQEFYHPSRCIFFFYGDIPLEKHLDFIEKNALKGEKKHPPLLPLSKQPKFKKPKLRKTFYPSLEKETILAFGWITTAISDEIESLAFNLLDIILMQTDASFLKRALLESGLVKQAHSYLDPEMSEIPYLIVCKGTKKEYLKPIYEIFTSALEKIIEKGIDQSFIKAALHQLEFSRLEISSNHSMPYGLSLFLRTALVKHHGCNPANFLKIHSLFKKLENDLKNPEYLPSLIKKHLLHNTHRVDLILQPDEKLQEKEEEKEKLRLQRIKDDLKFSEIEKILKDTKELKAYQKFIEGQSLECLPKIHSNEIEKKPQDFPLIKDKNRSFSTYCHPCFTNNILYLDYFYQASHIKKEDLFAFTLLTKFAPELGTKKRSYLQNLQYIQSYTGGVNWTPTFTISSKNPEDFEILLSLHGKALYSNDQKLFNLFNETIGSLDFTDKARMKELLHQYYTMMQSSLQKNPMQYALLQARTLTLPSKLKNELHGLPFIQKFHKKMKKPEKMLEQLTEEFNQIEKTLFNRPFDLVMGCDKEYLQKLQKKEFISLQNPLTPAEKKSSISIKKIRSQARIIPSSVFFNALSFKTVGYLDKDSPGLLLATELFENLLLHKKIREEKGAYGAGARYSPLSGDFYFFSYRDPYLASTVKTFYQSIRLIEEGKFSDQDIEDAKLGIFQNIDAPIAPKDRSVTSYFWQRSKKTLSMRLSFREKLLTANKEDIQKAVLAHLSNREGLLVSFGPENLLKKENGKFDHPLEIYSLFD